MKCSDNRVLKFKSLVEKIYNKNRVKIGLYKK